MKIILIVKRLIKTSIKRIIKTLTKRMRRMMKMLEKKMYPTFEEYLKNEYKGPYCATDIVIRHDDGNKEGIVIITRKNFPFGLALPGGMAERMRFEDNAVKEAREETGLEVIIDDPDTPLCVLSGVPDDPRAHIASITYTGRGRGALKPQAEEDADAAFVYTIPELKELLKKDGVWAFNRHRKILGIYLDRLGDDYHG